jgi:hypothetical protein
MATSAQTTVERIGYQEGFVRDLDALSFPALVFPDSQIVLVPWMDRQYLKFFQ